jgi:DMSO/TMAO reductase YedYZ molybdopterin-dependent catalytic subunit
LEGKLNKRLLLIIPAILLVLLSACQPNQPAPTAQPATPAASGSSTTSAPIVTVVGAKDTRAFTLDELKKLTVTEGQAGIKSSTGKITLPAQYKGILLTDLLKEAGGADESMGIQIEAKDGYAMTFSFEQVDKGVFVTYDPSTGDEVKDAGKLQVLLAFEKDGKPIDPEQEGDLHLVVISEKPNQVVDGHWSVKFINKVTIKPLAEEWSLVLQGAINDEVDRGTFESCSTGKCHQATWTDGKAQNWIGTPLYLLVGRVDDDKKHDTGAYNRKLAEQGYMVEIVGKDGFSVKLDSKRIEDNKNIIVAFQVNNNPLTDKDFPLKLVGSDLKNNEMVGGIAKIILHLKAMQAAEPTSAPAAATAEPTASQGSANSSQPVLTLTGLVQKEQQWTLDDLKKLDVVKLSVEHPKKGKMDVEGVNLKALLDMAGVKDDAKTFSMTASDGYSSQIDLKSVQSCKDCLVVFNESGGVNSVMVGMQSNLWVKNLAKIEIK